MVPSYYHLFASMSAYLKEQYWLDEWFAIRSEHKIDRLCLLLFFLSTHTLLIHCSLLSRSRINVRYLVRSCVIISTRSCPSAPASRSRLCRTLPPTPGPCVCTKSDSCSLPPPTRSDVTYWTAAAVRSRRRASDRNCPTSGSDAYANQRPTGCSRGALFTYASRYLNCSNDGRKSRMEPRNASNSSVGR